jgi:hypothetical protein
MLPFAPPPPRSFGRSDKPIDDDVYTFGFHRDWLVHFVTTHIVNDARTAQGGRVTLAVQGACVAVRGPRVQLATSLRLATG